MTISSLKQVESDLLRVEERVVQLLEKRAGALKAPAEMMFRSGGKRLRPALVLLSSRLFGPQPESAISVAAAVEMVHGASLIHDDVIDATEVRRGIPTLNSVTGNRFAVLLGDFLLCQALLAVAELDRVRLLQVVSSAVAEMTAGQILELRHQGNVSTTVEEYLRIIDGKTSALMDAGCQLGALLTTANPSQVEAVGRFGRNLGSAFQITDDVLDYWGDPDSLGKPTGSDLRERKFTLPFLDAYQLSSPEEQSEIRALVGEDYHPNGNGRSELSHVLAWMDAKDVRRRSLERASRFAGAARSELEHLPNGATRDQLFDLLDYVTARER